MVDLPQERLTLDLPSSTSVGWIILACLQLLLKFTCMNGHRLTGPVGNITSLQKTRLAAAAEREHHHLIRSNMIIYL